MFKRLVEDIIWGILGGSMSLEALGVSSLFVEAGEIATAFFSVTSLDVAAGADGSHS
jgi:hypothetical protein